ncbi:putative sodium-dependent multivitamin transporter [Parasteatoda tepidariorum]|uniref:putative sodium-dependent multivitamin transporter n=1 Tax=Parasteatoda tepidariorum TaxID=114398 RepID=UPI00077FC5DE|nr:putative sodium-dependent multivitamin transporter [Parasteatoda tepidariorum]XP_015913610.1 putative sodium-dependent multivitamin transporter [Parasteatoda tepidariorum]XP_015913611.1 putative sodium-dependent multivitamin transporter [Parasteatoda tepidariorum]
MATREVFEVWDYLVVATMLLISGAIGVYFRFSGGKQRTTGEYLMAGRNMGLVPVIISLMATVQTAVGTLGFPGEIYLYGAQLYLYPLGFTVALILVTFVHTPVFFGIKITSAYEYLERRFGKTTRTIISGLFIIQMVLFMSVGLYSPSIALSAVSGLSHFISILLVGIVCAFYCTLGGMKAVLWTDVFQSILMFFALLSVIIKGSIDVGGFQEMLNIAGKGGRLNFFNTTFDPTLRFTVWSALIGGFMYGLTTCGANQTQVQRLLCVSSLKRSQLALVISIPMNLLMYYTIYTCGLVIYANFAGCDPLLRSDVTGISSADQLFPYYMIRSFSIYPGMAGFCVSGIFCAALTSISSAVNSLAAVTFEDFVKPFCKCNSLVTEKSSARISKFFALFYSALCIAMTYIVGNIKAIIPAAFVVFTAIGGPTLSIITLGMISTTANEKGIIVGLLSGIALNAWIGTGSIVSDYPQIKLPQSIDMCPANTTNLFFETVTAISSTNVTLLDDLDTTSSVVTDGITVLKEEIFPLFKLSFLLHPVPGTILTFIVGYIVSFITGGDKNVDEDLICPFLRNYLSRNTIKSSMKLDSAVSVPNKALNLEEQNGFANHANGKNEKNGKINDNILEESKL